jgi:cyclopropane-fatty-acyl-phospholipid synthase
LDRHKKYIFEIANSAGVVINGNQPWDMQVHNEDLYKRIVYRGTLGLGEAYMEGWWDCDRMDLFFENLLRAKLETKTHFNFSVAVMMVAHLFTNMQSMARSNKVAEVHYDLSNAFYSKMLDQRMIYSCGYWKNAENLDQAQEEKLRLVCEKLELKPGEKLLDIGCGWGGLAKFAAENYGVNVTGITISTEQAKLAQQVCEGLDVEIRLQDYREISDSYDKIVSLGMFEHVGARNYRTYIKMINDRLKEDGLFLLHTIGHRYKTYSADPWANQYIFPNGKIPYIDHIGKAISGSMVMEDWHNFGPYYADTLMAWYKNFKQYWPMFKDNYDDKFYRMWEYYLLSFAGTFRARHMQLWQIVLTRQERENVYHSVRF